MDDVYKACERFERLGVEFVKKPDDGKLICTVVLIKHEKKLVKSFFLQDLQGYGITEHMTRTDVQ